VFDATIMSLRDWFAGLAMQALPSGQKLRAGKLKERLRPNGFRPYCPWTAQRQPPGRRRSDSGPRRATRLARAFKYLGIFTMQSIIYDRYGKLIEVITGSRDQVARKVTAVLDRLPGGRATFTETELVVRTDKEVSYAGFESKAR
jgi:hypothetical protein